MGHPPVDTAIDAPSASTEDAAGPSRPNLARRRLLRVGVLVPSVYTLAGGAATAAASTLACVNTNLASEPTRFTPGPDKWYRSQVYDGKVSGQAAHCVSTPQNACSDGNGGGQIGSVWVKNDNSRIVAGPGTQVNNVTSKPTSYGLVYVDQKGTISTLDPTGKTGVGYASLLCVNSMIGASISKLG